MSYMDLRAITKRWKIFFDSKAPKQAPRVPKPLPRSPNYLKATKPTFSRYSSPHYSNTFSPAPIPCRLRTLAHLPPLHIIFRSLLSDVERVLPSQRHLHHSTRPLSLLRLCPPFLRPAKTKRRHNRPSKRRQVNPF